MAPQYIGNYLEALLSRAEVDLSAQPSDVRVLDAGCGTGLVGEVLRSKGFAHVDGFDLCDKMVEVAEKTQAYGRLEGGCDLTKRVDHFDQDSYDAVVSAGVFTLGHVPPSALMELVHIARPGGLVVVSTRMSYARETPFEDFCRMLDEENRIDLLDVRRDAPYIEEEDAHYWAMKVN